MPLAEHDSRWSLWGVAMRGSDNATGSLFGYVDLEERIPARHPLRKLSLGGIEQRANFMTDSP